MTERNAILFLCILYTVGIIGFLLKIHPDFALLTPINLIISLCFALYFNKKTSNSFILICSIVAIIGYIIEVIGVNTGKIFGQYAYGPVLGFKLWQTPLSIGINWILLVYCSALTINMVFGKKWSWHIKAVMGSILMVLLDLLIEPVAIKTNMWTWTTPNAPLQNYIGWFFSALPLQLLMFYGIKNEENRVAVAVFILQFIFFLVLNFGL